MPPLVTVCHQGRCMAEGQPCQMMGAIGEHLEKKLLLLHGEPPLTITSDWLSIGHVAGPALIGFCGGCGGRGNSSCPPPMLVLHRALLQGRKTAGPTCSEVVGGAKTTVPCNFHPTSCEDFSGYNAMCGGQCRGRGGICGPFSNKDLPVLCDLLFSLYILLFVHLYISLFMLHVSKIS